MRLDAAALDAVTIDSPDRFAHTGEEAFVFTVQNQSHPPFEGFSDRVTDGTDQERTVAYSRWLKRLRENQGESDSARDRSSEQASR